MTTSTEELIRFIEEQIKTHVELTEFFGEPPQPGHLESLRATVAALRRLLAVERAEVLTSDDLYKTEDGGNHVIPLLKEGDRVLIVRGEQETEKQ